MTGPLDTAGPPLVEVAALVEAARRARETARGEALGLALLDRIERHPPEAHPLPADVRALLRLALALSRPRRAALPEPELLAALAPPARAALVRLLLDPRDHAPRPAAPWSPHV